MTGALARFVENHGRGVTLIVLSLSIAGTVLLFRLPVSIFPQTDFPRIIILANNGIAPVNTQLQQVTRPLEEAVRVVPGITDVRSVTARGSSEISLFFRWDIDILDALHLVQGRIAQVSPSLPPDTRFYINRLTFSVFPMLGLSLTSPTRSLSDLWQIAAYDISPRMYRLPGVAETRIVGGRQPEMHVVVDPDRLSAYGMPVTRVVEAIRQSNVIAPAGMIQENYHLYLVTVTGLVQSAEQLEDLVIDVVDGIPVPLKSVARVTPGEAPAYNIVSADGRDAVLVNVLQQPDGNALDVATAVKAELARTGAALPPDVRVGMFYDQSVLVRDSISGVTESIVIGLALAVLVLVGFLKSWRTTLVAALIIPVAILIAVVCMWLFDMSFNLMTLGGLAAAIGLVIDDAIVVVENIVGYLAMGQTPREAAGSAIRELTPALIGSTLTPIVVFAPLVFLGGITAVFFRALALTLVAALLASLLLAIFFTPVLASWIFLPVTAVPTSDAEAAAATGVGRFLRSATATYERALDWALDHTRLVLSGAAAVMLASVLVYFQLGSGFLPDTDDGAFVLDYVMPSGTSLEETDRVLRHIEEFLTETPEVESYSRRTGARLALAIAEPNTGDFLVRLRADRQRALDEVTSELRARIAVAEPVIEVEFPHILEDLVGDLAWSPEPIEIKIHHDDVEVAREIGDRVEAWLPTVNGVVDIVNQNVEIGPSINLRVDPETAGRAGFTVQDVADLESAIVDGTLASSMVRGDRSFGIRVRYPAESRSSSRGLQALLVTSPSGQTVPLGSIAQVETDETTFEIQRENLQEFTSVTAQLESRDLGSAMAEIQRRLPVEIEMPPEVDLQYGGLYRIQQESFRGLVQVLLGSILLIFIILVFEFRSFSHPCAILGATLLCGFGSLVALYVTGTTLNISSFMGVIMVVGIVHKNGILMLDSEKNFTERGYAPKEAIFRAGQRRLRPIAMTALSTLSGMLPLAIGVGSGAQMLQPLAIAVMGGVAVSLVLSLLVTPVLYYQLRGGHAR